MTKLSILILLLINYTFIFSISKSRHLIFITYLLSMTILIYIPSLFDKNINQFLGNSLILNLIFTLIGFIGSNYLFSKEYFKKIDFIKEFNKLLNTSYRNIINLLKTANIIIIISLILYYFIVKEIPLFSFLGGADTATITLTRETSFKLLLSPLKIYFVLLRDTFIPISLFYFSYYLKKSNLSYKLLYFVFFVFSFIFSSASLAKLPIILTAFSAFLGYSRSINFKSILKIILLLLSLYYLTMVITTPYRGFEVFVKIYERIFVVPYKVNEFYFDAIPEFINHSRGGGLGKLSFIFTNDKFNMGNAMYRYIAGDKDIISLSGSANGGYLASLWAEFSYAGIIIGTFIVSFSALALDLLFQSKYKKNVIGLSIYYFCAYQYMTLTIIPIQLLIFSGLPLLILLLLLNWKNPKTFNI